MRRLALIVVVILLVCGSFYLVTAGYVSHKLKLKTRVVHNQSDGGCNIPIASPLLSTME